MRNKSAAFLLRPGEPRASIMPHDNSAGILKGLGLVALMLALIGSLSSLSHMLGPSLPSAATVISAAYLR
jgi:hypothetical protein